jgi:hypothetical protein
MFVCGKIAEPRDIAGNRADVRIRLQLTEQITAVGRSPRSADWPLCGHQHNREALVPPWLPRTVGICPLVVGAEGGGRSQLAIVGLATHIWKR